MKRNGIPLQKPYQTALLRHIKQGTEVSLRSAQRLGRRAVVLGLETLDLALVHEQALVAAVETLATSLSATRNSIVRRSGAFFAEAILPMEATHRASLDVNARLNNLNQMLKRRSQDLIKSNQSLIKEIARRKTVQESLRRSEAHTGQLLEQSRLMQEQLRLLSRRVLSVQEEERKRISRELHDVIAQMLTGINVRLATLKAEAAANTRGLGVKIARAQRLVEKSVDVVHRFARELRPAMLDDLGLIPAVHSHLKAFLEETGIRVNLVAFKGEDNLPAVTRTALYRVIQEALVNVARHAQASRVDIAIRKLPNAVQVQIQDDGKSFDVQRTWRKNKGRHLGMIGMRERVEMIGGSFTAESASGRGTLIQASVPLVNAKREVLKT